MLTHRYDDALCLAARLHRSQCRKVTAIPYLSHLLSVSALVIEYGGDEDQAIAGLLHDAVEDAGGHATGEAIRAQFGDRVADMVYACSDSDGAAKAPWKQRKDAYIAAIPGKGDALLVTCADKVHNVTTILEDLHIVGPDVFDRFTAGKAGTLWYYQSLSTALTAAFPGALSDRLARIVDNLTEAAR